MILCVDMWYEIFTCIVFFQRLYLHSQSYSHYGELFEGAWQPFTKRPRLRISDFAGQRVRLLCSLDFCAGLKHMHACTFVTWYCTYLIACACLSTM